MITFKAKETSGEIINSALHEFTFPAGEKHIKQTEGRDLQPVEIAIFQPSATSVHDDLFALAMWNDYIVQNGPDTRNVLIMPYVPGARADRGAPFGLGVYAEFINNLEIDQIIIFDPHSNRTPQILKAFENLTVVYPAELFQQDHVKSFMPDYDGIIAPDAGALTRAKGVADALGLPVITATKTRDEATGKLSNFQIEGLSDHKYYLIVDDICDRGGTFKGLIKAAGLPWPNIDLYVSHGVFSSDALHELPDYFENVYTTNSYDPARDLNPEGYNDQDTFTRFDAIHLFLSKIKF